jgi:hypothetical protein
MEHKWIYSQNDILVDVSIDYKSHVDIKNINDIPKEAVGFIYRIIDENGRQYIGQKSLYTKRKKHFGKRELSKIKDKRKKTYKYVIKESNWLSYTGSNKELNENINNGLKYTKQILKYCFSKKQLNYYETKYLMIFGVIEPGNASYNANVQGKFYPKDLLNESN